MGKNNKRNSNNKQMRRGKSVMSSDAVVPTQGPHVPPPNLQLRRLPGTVQHLRRTLSYVGYGTTSVPEGVTVQQNYRMNSAYQPDSFASPYGFAKYMAFYSKCYVLGARARVSFSVDTDNSSAITDQPYRFKGVVGFTISTTNPTIVTEQAIGQSLTDFRMVATTSQTGVLSVGLEVSKFLDKPRVLDDPDLFSTSGAPPIDIIYGTWWASAERNDMQVTRVTQLDFDVVFVDPVPFS